MRQLHASEARKPNVGNWAVDANAVRKQWKPEWNETWQAARYATQQTWPCSLAEESHAGKAG
ncbi:hypothetical protein LPH50_08385 [Xylella taiwanensis]|nr:hypothetical protein [Xylella taiwanensis]MCD8467433.1 hypothetical protein [Xylella taiwanensis]UFN08491.1 hypothetical protein LPH45_08270 [Xylella taiwanensis]UFN13071.1 hypothetical protein LPH61_08265 [Xylella taiwanensis]UFN15383.1 hypothetical protein LPH50_08385 [Xylella taiwanensis]UFN31239.1 hypothetical protein LPH63_09215 [Xylella taiwanensis]